MPKVVIVESPFAGEIDRNVTYARMALRDCLLRGESPFASHLLYTQDGILDDTIPAERDLGINAGLALGQRCDFTAFYLDLGISTGMSYGLTHARQCERPVEVRSLPGWSLAGHDGKSKGQSEVLMRLDFLNRKGGSVAVGPGGERAALPFAPQAETQETALKNLILVMSHFAKASPPKGAWTVVTVDEGHLGYRMRLIPAPKDQITVIAG